MSFPAGITPATIIIGQLHDQAGDTNYNGMIKITPSSSCIHVPTGTPFSDSPIYAEMTDGSATVQLLPSDADNMSVTNRLYTFDFTDIVDPSGNPVNMEMKEVFIPSSATSIDFDTMLPQAHGPQTIYFPTVATISGLTGVITTAQLVAAMGADPFPGYASDADISAAMTAHTSAPDPHPQYTTGTEAATAAGAAAAASMATHLADSDPHTQYTTTSEATALAASAASTHEGALDPHPQYTTGSEAAAAAASAVSTHEAAVDPHPQYTTATEAATAASSAAASSMTTHTSASDPHTQYTPKTRSIETGVASVSGLTGGGTLAGDLNLAVDASYIKALLAAALVGGTNVTITPNSPTAGQVTISASGGGSTDPEVVRDTIGATLLAGSGIGIVVDDAGNTITISNTSGSTAYNVDILPPDTTGTIAANTAIATAVSTVNSLYSTSRGAHTVSLRFAPGTFLVTDPTVFDALVLNSSAERGVTVCGPTEVGKRSVLIKFSSSQAATTDQTKGCLFRFINNRQFTIRDIGFQSTNANQTLFYHFCSFGSDEGSLYPEFPVSTAQNSGRYRRIYVDGDWKVITGYDGGIRANLNSEMAFEDWTFGNSLTIADAGFKFGYALRDAVFLSTGIGAPTAGTFTLTYNGSTTSALAYNASAATIQSALEGLSTIGTGNVTVTASSTPTAGSYVVKFINAMAGVVNTALLSTATSGWSATSWKVFRFPPQQGQFLNYAFRNNEFEYARGTLFQLNRGGCITFEGYHSVIVGIGGGTNGGTLFDIPEVATHPNDCCKLKIAGNFRAELRTQYGKIIDCNWHGVNKFISFDHMTISVNAISGGATGSTVKAMEVMAFRNTIDNLQAFIRIAQTDIPGYITIQNTGTGAGGGKVIIEQCRFESWTGGTITGTSTPSGAGATLFASQSALAADTAAPIRVLGSAVGYHLNVVNASNVAFTDGSWSA